jgi:hypothetical protein
MLGPHAPSVQPIERRNMNLWEEENAQRGCRYRSSTALGVRTSDREASVSFPVPSILAAGYEVFVVGDACGGLTCR